MEPRKSHPRIGLAGGVMADSLDSVRFPNESDEYRAARIELLKAEIDLRRQIEEVAARRRRLPLDGLDGQAQHVTQRVNLVVAAKSPIRRIREHARERGWTGLRLVSTGGTTYNRDYHGESDDGEQIPAINVFVRRGDRVHHFYNAELLYAPHPDGQDPRHGDLIWPLWNLFDLTHRGAA